MFSRRTYLDIAAGVSGNPSSPHTEGRHAKQMLEDARNSIARLVEVQADDVVFTSGATESNALAILGTVQAGDHMFYLPSAHASIVENAALLNKRGVEVEELPIKNARVDCEKLKELLRPETKLISME
ncbi:MAG: aminotransferase class V-fold PLP-dependent enzyme, partial [bacterium]|nr:aminotransferase class V-fold PLP-dependent enzyme [bacterium]